MLSKILIIRRDNIGDLVCTTPLMASIRNLYPMGWLAALVNDYNMQVLTDNPDLDKIYVYTKLKHRRRGEFALAVMWRTWSMVRELKAQRLDTVVIASPNAQKSALKYALWVRPKQIVMYENPLLQKLKQVRQSVTSEGWAVKEYAAGPRGAVLIKALSPEVKASGNEVEVVHRLGSLLGIHHEPGPLRMLAGPSAVGRVSHYFRKHDPNKYRVVIHISGRHPSRRWPLERWQRFLEIASPRLKAEWILLWAPGPADDPGHPGDDEKADALIAFAKNRGFGLTPVPTRRLDELIGAMAHADAVICTDGGAMHVAAAQGKPMVVMFGQTSVEHWRPWGVEQKILQADSRQVADLAPEAVLQAVETLMPCLLRVQAM